MKFALYQQEVQEVHVATPLKHRGPFPNNCYYSVHCCPKLSSKQLSRAEWKVACRPLSKENKNDVTVPCISAPPTFFQNNTFKGKQAAKAALPSHRSVEPGRWRGDSSLSTAGLFTASSPQERGAHFWCHTAAGKFPAARLTGQCSFLDLQWRLGLHIVLIGLLRLV